MKKREYQDQDLADMFAVPEHFDDAEAFDTGVMRRLQVKMWLRQWLVVLAGFVGGIYALAQVVRVPDWKVDGQALYTRAAVDTDQTLRAGARIVDAASRNFVTVAEQPGGYLAFMQTPLFFWLSFTLCLAILGLYYAYSQEETL